MLNLSGKEPLTNRSSTHRAFKLLVKKVAERRVRRGQTHSSRRLQESSVHWLRHSFFTTLIASDTDLSSVKELARHRDLNTTMIYLEHEDGALNQILDDVFREL